MLQKIKIENELEFEEKKTLDFYNTYEIPEAKEVNLLKENEDKVYLPEEVCSSIKEAISSKYNKGKPWNTGKRVRQKFKKVTSI